MYCAALIFYTLAHMFCVAVYVCFFRAADEMMRKKHQQFVWWVDQRAVPINCVYLFVFIYIYVFSHVAKVKLRADLLNISKFHVKPVLVGMSLIHK